MRLYRFSPIGNSAQLLQAITHIHLECHRLCLQVFGKYLPNAGNMGVFCHYQSEYEQLIKIRQELTVDSDNINQKYYRLHEPIMIPARDGVPETLYHYLYIRQPDPYRHHVGDVDFYLQPEEYAALKKSLLDGTIMNGARIFPRPDLDMVELHDSDFDILAYVSTKTMTEQVRTKTNAS